jgi:hypothetical protein
MSSAAAPAPSVLLLFSLADSPRTQTQIVEWFEDLSAKARGLCVQWDPTVAITLIATDAVWNAISGNITNLADVLTNGASPQYMARPDFNPPAALDPAATTVELANWCLEIEMGMHFAYTLAQNALALVLALLDSVGAANKASLKVEFHSTPLHF